MTPRERTVTIRVALKVRGFVRCLGVVEEVEATRLVRAVGGAVPRAPASCVHHGIKPFRGVDGGVDRADGFARRLAALLAATGMAVMAPVSVKYLSMRIQSRARPFAIWSRPTTGMLFSARQATMHALQPMHRDVSMAIFHW